MTAELTSQQARDCGSCLFLERTDNGSVCKIAREMATVLPLPSLAQQPTKEQIQRASGRGRQGRIPPKCPKGFSQS